MKTNSQLWRFAPLAVAAIALVGDGVLRGSGLGGQSGTLGVLALLGIGAALYRVRGWPSLAMGACVLPLAIEISGPITAALLAVVILVGRQSISWILERELEPVASASDRTGDLLLSVGPAALAVVAAGWLRAALPAIGVGPGTVASTRPGGLTDLGQRAEW